MKKQYWLVLLALLPCLFIYLFYRTEQTVVTDWFVRLISSVDYRHISHTIKEVLPLPNWIVYSLPGALWIFAITISSGHFTLPIRKYNLPLNYLPLIIAIGFETFQLLGIIAGTFDWLDLLLSILFWVFGLHILSFQFLKRASNEKFSVQTVTCGFSYLIVYLAHVWR